MTPEYILKASLAAVKQGRELHCFSSWIKGQGYIGKADTPNHKEEHLRQAIQACEQEIENITHAPKYADRNEETKGIFFANWNKLPSKTSDLLEKLGYSVEWSDEWTTCADCQGALRTVEDSFIWIPYFKEIEGDTVCLDCCPKEEEEEEDDPLPDGRIDEIDKF
jgi:uncharacterized protein with PIN domain